MSPTDAVTAGADLLAAVIGSEAPPQISGTQLLALVAAAQYFLAEELLEPLSGYAEPVISALDVQLVRFASKHASALYDSVPRTCA